MFQRGLSQSGLLQRFLLQRGLVTEKWAFYRAACHKRVSCRRGLLQGQLVLKRLVVGEACHRGRFVVEGLVTEGARCGWGLVMEEYL